MRYRNSSALKLVATLCFGSAGCDRPDVDSPNQDISGSMSRLDSVHVIEIAKQAYRREDPVDSLIVLQYTKRSDGWAVMIGLADVHAVGGGRTILVRPDRSSTVIWRGQ